MSSNDLENDIKPEIPAKRVKFEDKDSDDARKKLSIILQREIETEIKLRKNDLDTIEENIFLTKQSLLRLKQGVVTDYYKQKNQKEYLQYTPHPAIKDTFLGKCPRDNTKIETSKINLKENLYIKEEIEKETEPIVLKEEDSVIGENSKPLECPKPPCYIPPKPVKVETVKPPEPRGFVSKKQLRIVVGNVSKWLAPKECAGATHKWTVYTKSADPDVDLSEFVSKVVFFLHPSYKPNDVISVTEPPFKLTRRGWGEFPLKTRFHFKNSLDLPVDVMHILKLDHKHTGLETFGSETTLTVWIHLPVKEEPISLNEESVKKEISENFDILEMKSTFETLNEENNSFIFKQDDVYERNGSGLCLDEKNINKHNLDELNSSFTKEDIENFLLDETNLTNFPFTGDFLNSLADEEYKNIHLPNFIGTTSQNNTNEQTRCQLEHSHDGSDYKNSDPSVGIKPQPCDDFLEECNFVESEVVIDCDDESSENLGGNEEILCDPEEVSGFQEIIVDDGISENNCDLTSKDAPNQPLIKTSEISGKDSILSYQVKNANFEINSTPHKNKGNNQVIGKEGSAIMNCNVSSNILLNETNSQKISKFNLNNGLLAKTDTKAHEDSQDASLNKVLIQNSPVTVSNSVKIGKNILKGKIITIVKSNDKSFNILGSTLLPKQILLSSLNGSKKPILTMKKNDTNRSAMKASASGDGCSVPNVYLPKSETKWSSVKEEVPNVSSLMNNDAISSEKSSTNTISTQENSVFPMNSLPIKSSNLTQNTVVPICPLVFGNKKKKRAVSNKEVKSTVITLQKENGQVILRKEAKFKECKESIVPAILKPEKPQVLLRDLKLQNEKANKNNKNIVLDESNSAVISINSFRGSTKSSLLKLELPQSSSNNLSIGEKKILLVNQKNVITPSKPPLVQKVVAPVSLLKKLNQEIFGRGEELKDTNKESVLLKRCPTQNTEIAVSWLIKRFPLVDSRAHLSGFRSKHPYCAKTRDEFLNWPFPKQRAAEWMRAKALGKILEKLPGIAKWSTLEILDWARIRAFTPMKIDPDLKDSSILPDTQYFYIQPTEEIIDFIRRCKDLKEKEVVDVTTIDVPHTKKISSGSFPASVTSRETGYKFNLIADKDETPFEPELQGMREFINKCQRNVGAATSPEPLCPGILYASAERVLISAFYSVAEDIIRRAHNSSWIRHSEKSPSEVSVDDVKRAILSRKEFDFLVPSKTEKKERPPVTILPNFS